VGFGAIRKAVSMPSGYATAPVGRSLSRGDTRARSCADAVVVLRWHCSGTAYVLTSYPECPQ
jgi:hypothetical protein